MSGRSNTMQINRLTASDAPAYRALMLEAYEQAADAFTSTAAERSGEPLSWWEKRIASADGSSESFGAFAGPSLAGSVALEYSTKPKTRHSALLIGMYLRPASRGSGAAGALVNAAIQAAQARPEIQCLRLTVTEGNEPAIRLYQSFGFVAWGTEPHAIRTPAGFKGKVHMTLRLPRATALAPAGLPVRPRTPASLPAPFQIRLARPADALCLGALSAQVFFDTYATKGINAELAGEVQTQGSQAVFASRLASSDVEIAVAEVEGHLVGFIDVQGTSTCPVSTVTGPEVLRLYIQGPFQNQGIGRALLQHAEERARAQGAEAIWLTAWVGNTRAVAFYAQVGYQQVGSMDYIISGKGYENHVFARRLPVGSA